MARLGSKERERYWRGVFRDQKSSGLPISTFCRDRKVSEGSFFNLSLPKTRSELVMTVHVDHISDLAAVV